MTPAKLDSSCCFLATGICEQCRQEHDGLPENNPNLPNWLKNPIPLSPEQCKLYSVLGGEEFSYDNVWTSFLKRYGAGSSN